MVNKNKYLFCINIGDEKQYFTSARKAGFYLGIQASSILYAYKKGNKVITKDNRVCTITFEDGSDVPYKYINNL